MAHGDVEHPKSLRRFIPDDPSSEDQFSGGGHARTARTLAKTISEFSSDDRAIGLEGSWGSGKSTVIKLAKCELETSSYKKYSYKVFEFDLWQNCTVPFRRAFLEALLSWGEREYKNKTAFIEKTKKIVGDRVRQIETKNQKRFSLYGIVILIFLFCLPVIYTWFSPFALSKKVKGVLVVPEFTTFAFWAVILVLLLGVLRTVYCWMTSNQKFSYILSDTLSLYTREDEETTITQNIRDEDPTQYEFSQVFRSIVSEFQSENQRIVIVLDNLDRLPKEKITEAWSEVFAIFGDRGILETDSKSVTLIIPYDRAHVLSAFSPRDTLNQVDRGASASGLGFMNQMSHDQTEDFFRKIFDAIFYVAPPVVSDAFEFFADRFKFALNDSVSEDTISRVYQILDHYISGQERPATPRQIKSFINESTLLWEQWKGEVSLEAIGVYIAHRNEIEMDPANLRIRNIPDDTYRSLAAQPNIERELASIAYNVDQDLAFQTYLRNPIINALISGNSEDLNDISKSKGFDEILIGVVRADTTRWPTENIILYSNAVGCIENAKLSESTSEACKSLLLRNINHLQVFPISKLKQHRDIKHLLSFCNLDNVSNVLNSILKASIGNYSETDADISFHDGENWAEYAGELLRAATAKHREDGIQHFYSTFILPNNLHFSLGFLHCCGKNNLDFSRVCAPAIDENPTAFWDEIKEWISSYPIEFHEARNQIMPIAKGTIHFELATKSVESLLIDRRKEDPETLAKRLSDAVNLICSITDPNQQVKVLDQLTSNGVLFQYAKIFTSQENSLRRIGLGSIFFLVLFRTGAESPPNNNYQQHGLGNIQPSYDWYLSKLSEDPVDEELATEISEKVLQLKLLSTFVSFANSNDTGSSLLQSVVLKAFELEPNYLLDMQAFIQNYSFLQSFLGENFDSLLSTIGTRAIDEYWEGFEFSTAPMQLVRDVARRTESGWLLFNKKLDALLNSLEVHAWQEAFENDSHVVSLLRIRVENSGIKLHVRNYKEAILSHTLDVFSGEKSALKEMDLLIEALPEQTAKNFYIDVVDRLPGRAIEVEGLAALLVDAPKFMKRINWENAQAPVLGKFLSALILCNSDNATKYITSRSTNLSAILQNSEPTIVSIVKEALDGFINSEDAEEQERTEKIRKALAIPKSDETEH